MTTKPQHTDEQIQSKITALEEERKTAPNYAVRKSIATKISYWKSFRIIQERSNRLLIL